MGNKCDMECNFRLHWLNNKELHFTVEAEKILHDLHKRLLYDEHQKDDVTAGTGFDSEEHDPDHDLDPEYDHCHDSDEEEMGKSIVHVVYAIIIVIIVLLLLLLNYYYHFIL